MGDGPKEEDKSKKITETPDIKLGEELKSYLDGANFNEIIPGSDNVVRGKLEGGHVELTSQNSGQGFHQSGESLTGIIKQSMSASFRDTLSTLRTLINEDPEFAAEIANHRSLLSGIKELGPTELDKEETIEHEKAELLEVCILALEKHLGDMGNLPPEKKAAGEVYDQLTDLKADTTKAPWSSDDPLTKEEFFSALQIAYTLEGSSGGLFTRKLFNFSEEFPLGGSIAENFPLDSALEKVPGYGDKEIKLKISELDKDPKIILNKDSKDPGKKS